MAIEVFNRYEKKYMLSAEQYLLVTKALLKHMRPDKYNEDKEFYKICNIYYDTKNDALIRASIEKPVYKEKLRLRSYGDVQPDDYAFIEIKKKYKAVVNKRRTGVRLDKAYDYLDGKISREELCVDEKVNTQVIQEIDYFKNFYKVMPKVYLSYDRRAYFEIDDGDFRVTFDTNITTRRDDLRLENGSYGKLLLPEDKYLMEIKINGAVPIWFARIMSEYNVYPVSFSKYGTEYKEYLYDNLHNINQENGKGRELCLNQFLLHQQIAQLT